MPSSVQKPAKRYPARLTRGLTPLTSTLGSAVIAQANGWLIVVVTLLPFASFRPRSSVIVTVRNAACTAELKAVLSRNGQTENPAVGSTYSPPLPPREPPTLPLPPLPV